MDDIKDVDSVYVDSVYVDKFKLIINNAYEFICPNVDCSEIKNYVNLLFESKNVCIFMDDPSVLRISSWEVLTDDKSVDIYGEYNRFQIFDKNINQLRVLNSSDCVVVCDGLIESTYQIIVLDFDRIDSALKLDNHTHLADYFWAKSLSEFAIGSSVPCPKDLIKTIPNFIQCELQNLCRDINKKFNLNLSVRLRSDVEISKLIHDNLNRPKK